MKDSFIVGTAKFASVKKWEWELEPSSLPEVYVYAQVLSFYNDRHKFIKLGGHLCLQHVSRDAESRVDRVRQLRLVRRRRASSFTLIPALPEVHKAN